MKELTEPTIYGLHQTCFIEWFDVGQELEFSNLDPKSSSSTKVQSPEITKKKDTFFHGRYAKYSARLGSVEYILKVQEDDFPELPVVEFVCNKIAALLSIDIPKYYLIDFNGRTTFVTRNFMQDYPGGTLHHLYKFLPEGEESHCCEKIIHVLLQQTGKLADVAKFIEICLFDSFIGNNDRHGRNLGLIETSKQKKLAPMYDNPSFIGIEKEFILGAHFNPSGSIWTQDSKEPKPADYIYEFRKLGHDKIVLQFCSKVISRFSTITKAVMESNISQKRKEAFINILESRIEEFENAR
ncbi:MAG: HipA domain-containing protein [Bdellovibrionales bacterium]|nr:HipA domain-containing protein [Bdellovibrionales bacterium]